MPASRTPRLPLLAAIGSVLAAGPIQASDPAPDVERAAFLAADADGDGRLSRAEFEPFVRMLAEAGAPTPVLIRRLGAYGIAFSRADLDGDGFATPQELRAADAAQRAE